MRGHASYSAGTKRHLRSYSYSDNLALLVVADAPLFRIPLQGAARKSRQQRVSEMERPPQAAPAVLPYALINAALPPGVAAAAAAAARPSTTTVTGPAVALPPGPVMSFGPISTTAAGTVAPALQPSGSVVLAVPGPGPLSPASAAPLPPRPSTVPQDRGAPLQQPVPVTQAAATAILQQLCGGGTVDGLPPGESLRLLAGGSNGLLVAAAAAAAAASKQQRTSAASPLTQLGQPPADGRGPLSAATTTTNAAIASDMPAAPSGADDDDDARPPPPAEAMAAAAADRPVEAADANPLQNVSRTLSGDSSLPTITRSLSALRPGSEVFAAAPGSITGGPGPDGDPGDADMAPPPALGSHGSVRAAKPSTAQELGLAQAAPVLGVPMGAVVEAVGPGRQVALPTVPAPAPLPAAAIASVAVAAGNNAGQQAVVMPSHMPDPVDVFVIGQDANGNPIEARGKFYPDRYLANLDCIWHKNQFIGRSRFEAEGGSKVAKWQCSIKVGGVARTRRALWRGSPGDPCTTGKGRCKAIPYLGRVAPGGRCL